MEPDEPVVLAPGERVLYQAEPSTAVEQHWTLRARAATLPGIALWVLALFAVLPAVVGAGTWRPGDARGVLGTVLALGGLVFLARGRLRAREFRRTIGTRYVVTTRRAVLVQDGGRTREVAIGRVTGVVVRTAGDSFDAGTAGFAGARFGRRTVHRTVAILTTSVGPPLEFPAVPSEHDVERIRAAVDEAHKLPPS